VRLGTGHILVVGDLLLVILLMTGTAAAHYIARCNISPQNSNFDIRCETGIIRKPEL
jgi:hypothetical protein